MIRYSPNHNSISWTADFGRKLHVYLFYQTEREGLEMKSFSIFLAKIGLFFSLKGAHDTLKKWNLAKNEEIWSVPYFDKQTL